MNTVKEIMDLIDVYAEEKRIEHVYASRDLSPVLRNNLLEAVETLVKNAERYLWLRDIGDSTWVPLKDRWFGLDDQCEAHIDAAIKDSK